MGTAVVASMCATLLGALGCGSDEKTIETEMGDVTLTQDREGVSIEAKGGEYEGRFGQDAELPEGFPDDVPIPGSAKVMGAMTSREPGSEGSMVSLQSEGPADDLLEAFRGGLEDKGWAIEEETSTMGWRILHASKDGRALIVQVMERDGGSHAMLHLGQ